MSCITLCKLPDIAIKQIFSYLTFGEVARLRVVNRDFNTIGKEILISGFIKVEIFHNVCLKEARAQLPRRESERRSHPLARHVDVLMAIETRLSMLSMTYSKYIDAGLACFIPGEVLDEIYRVLRLVHSSEFPPRTHEILQELRDISSMAMEHFDEKISPELKQKLNPHGNRSGLLFDKEGSSRRLSYTLQPNHHRSVAISDHDVVPRVPATDECRKSKALEQEMRQIAASTTLMNFEIKSLKSKVRQQSRLMVVNERKISENTSKISEHSTQLAELKRLFEEHNQKIPSTSDCTCNKSLPSTLSENSKSKEGKRKKLSGGDEESPKKKKKSR